MSKFKENIPMRNLIILFTVLLITIICLIIYVKEIQKQKLNDTDNVVNIKVVSEEKKQTQTISIPKTEEELIKHLSTLGERDRIEYYCGQYFKLLESKEYQKAYNLLYDEFKQNYFPTLESFTQYIQKTYPDDFALDYDDITRQGYIYVLRLKILDVLGSKENEKIQRVVIKENSYNNYVISFQVI